MRVSTQDVAAPLYVQSHIYRLHLSIFGWLGGLCQVLRESLPSFTILTLTTMSHPTQPSREYKCPAEGCPRILKSSGAVSQHMRKDHPEVQCFGGAFNPCKYYPLFD